MATQIVVKGDVGTVLQMTVRTGPLSTDPVVDLTGAVTAFLVQRPDGTSVEWAAIIDGSPTAGVLKYTTVTGDMEISGVYVIQARITQSGNVFHATPVQILCRNVYQPWSADAR